MRDLVISVTTEYVRYKALAEAAFAQVTDEDLSVASGGNSIAQLVWHISGNLASRFTDFRTSDGEKPWRHRDEEFVARTVTRAELVEKWERGWRVLFTALDALTDADLGDTVTLRRQPLRIHEALHRSLAHASYHVGQIVFIAKARQGDRWNCLSIPLGQSETYNANPNPDRERPRLPSR
jgi:uncharacterized damage-inducible protein DinB